MVTGQSRSWQCSSPSISAWRCYPSMVSTDRASSTVTGPASSAGSRTCGSVLPARRIVVSRFGAATERRPYDGDHPVVRIPLWAEAMDWQSGGFLHLRYSCHVGSQSVPSCSTAGNVQGRDRAWRFVGIPRCLPLVGRRRLERGLPCPAAHARVGRTRCGRCRDRRHRIR